MADFVAQVLVVEDETLQRTVLLDSLRSGGHLVTGAGSAEEAVAILERISVEVAVVDIFLPGRSGIELLRAIKSASPRTEVVVITARPTLQLAVDSLSAGAFDFLMKPVDEVRLGQSVQRAIEHGRMRGRAAVHEALAQLRSSTREELPQRAVEAVRDVLLADETSLMVPCEDESLTIAASTSLAPEIQARVRLRLGERIAGRVAADRKPALLSDSLREDPRFSGIKSNGRLVSSIVYPLVHKDSLRGVLTIGRCFGSRAFRCSDMEIAADMASFIAWVLHDADQARAPVTENRLSSMTWLAPALEHVLDSLPSGVGSSRLSCILGDLKRLGRTVGQPKKPFVLSGALEVALRLSALEKVAAVKKQLEERCVVDGREGAITQVLFGLLIQAREVAEASERQVDFELTCRRDGACVIVQLSGHHCELWSRDEGASEMANRPVGQLPCLLGPSLAWCKEVVVRHGGTIDPCAKEGEKRSLVLRLPAASKGAGQVA